MERGRVRAPGCGNSGWRGPVGGAGSGGAVGVSGFSGPDSAVVGAGVVPVFFRCARVLGRRLAGRRRGCRRAAGRSGMRGLVRG